MATEAKTGDRRSQMSIWSVTALGIGSMVGAGIFALLGQAAIRVGRETWLSFALAGLVATLSGYAYARLSSRYPSSGGITRFFEEAFGKRGILSGTLSLLYLITLPITIAMVAKTFGAYATKLFVPEGDVAIYGLFGSLIVVVLALVNSVGAGAVGRAEVGLVAIKITILAGLFFIGAYTMMSTPHHLQEHVVRSPWTLIASVGLTFFAYAGYGMMANAAGAVANPQRTIPRAIYLAIGLVTLLYVGLAITVLGLVPPEALVRYADTAVAEAARPVLGNAGFAVVAVGALLATASAINATLFAALNVGEALARSRQLPHAFEEHVKGRSTRGFLGGVVVVLVMVNFLSLRSIANIASATFLLSYLAVFFAAWKLAEPAKISRSVIALGTALMLVAICAFLVSLVPGQLLSLFLIVLAVVGCVLVELVMQLRQPRRARAT